MILLLNFILLFFLSLHQFRFVLISVALLYVLKLDRMRPSVLLLDWFYIPDILYFFTHCSLFTDHCLVMVKGLVYLSEAKSHAMWGHPRWTGHSGEYQQNAVHWKRAWQTTPVYLLWEPHEQCKKAERYDDTEKWAPPGREVFNVLLGKIGGQLLIALERRKWLGQNGSAVQLWVCLVIKVKSNAVNNTVA